MLSKPTAVLSMSSKPVFYGVVLCILVLKSLQPVLGHTLGNRCIFIPYSRSICLSNHGEWFLLALHYSHNTVPRGTPLPEGKTEQLPCCEVCILSTIHVSVVTATTTFQYCSALLRYVDEPLSLTCTPSRSSLIEFILICSSGRCHTHRSISVYVFRADPVR